MNNVIQNTLIQDYITENFTSNNFLLRNFLDDLFNNYNINYLFYEIEYDDNDDNDNDDDNDDDDNDDNNDNELDFLVDDSNIEIFDFFIDDNYSIYSIFSNLLRSSENDSVKNKQNIPIKNFEVKYTDYKHLNDCCYICLEDFKEDTKVIKLNCKHLYHNECISNWYKYNPICPCCKTKIDT